MARPRSDVSVAHAPVESATVKFRRQHRSVQLALDGRLAFTQRANRPPPRSVQARPNSQPGSIAIPITGRCHCGSVVFEIDGEIPPQLTRCTCSFCSKRGQLYAYYAPAHVTLLAGSAAPATYRWNTKQIAHQFCPTCGCGVLSDSPAFRPDGSWDGKTRRLGINARLFDDFDAAAAPVTVVDGKNLW